MKNSKQLIEMHIERQAEALDSWVKTGPIISQRLQSQGERIEALETAHQHLQQRIETVEATMDSWIKASPEIRDRIMSQEKRIETLEATIKALHKRIERLEQEQNRGLLHKLRDIVG